ncbi:hypothetical protein OEA41_006177 [Lepraria neglecta]|uniref:Uncharacterized protein n=1 Tax=Lepraria neglecta TaxID=209136 RepID=A0AAD9ZAR0_9LECA|nr:hypothetical protein OEA41_006177 [Lepraria neglecta]
MSKQGPFQSTGASPADGSHIASGKYQSRVVSLRSKYPNITYPNDPNEHYPRYKPPPGVKKLGKVTVLKFEGEQVPTRTDLVEGRELQTFLQRSSPERDADTTRRLYLVEGWDPDLIVNRKASYWSRTSGRGGWDAILFLDPPVREIFIGSPPHVQQVSVPGEPYQGGYPDFSKYEDLDDACSSCGPSRQPMLEDICFYWTHHRKSIVVADEPVVATIFLRKIVASNYMLCIGYIVALLGELDYNVSRRDRPISELDITWVEERWKDLQAWNRQCAQYCDSVEAILDSFEISLSENEAPSSWESCEKDFHVI